MDEHTPDDTRLVVKKNKREDREGKRWIRRKENCTFLLLNAIARWVHRQCLVSAVRG